MEHRGGCGGDSDSGDGAGILCSIPWTFLDRELNLDTKTQQKRGLGMIFMPNNESKVKESKLICDEEAKKLNFKETFWRNVPIKNETLGLLAKANAPFISQWIICLEKDDTRDIEMLLFQLRKRIEKRIRESTKNAVGDLSLIHI